MSKILILIISFPLYTFSGESIEIYKTDKFEIVPPKYEIGKNGTMVSLMMPPSSGFSNNVNVMIQDFSGNLIEYDKNTKNQIVAMNFKIHESKIKENEIVYEYSGQSGQYNLHWYARAVKDNNKIYLITATCLEINWQNSKSELVKSVNSFKFIK